MSGLNRAHKDMYIHYEPAGDGIDFEPEQPEFRREGDKSHLKLDNDGVLIQEYKLVHNEAKDLDLKRDLENLCAKYKSNFSTILGKEPAQIPPFVMDVDDEKW